jgi:RNase P/RNase MRP subunit p30
MAYDLLLPNENEQELAKAAAGFGITPIFLYPFKEARELHKKRESLKALSTGHYVGIYVKPRSVGDIKKAAKLWMSADFLAVIDPGELVRVAVSVPRVDAVFRVPSGIGKDALEYRRSNWNAVLSGIAQKNKVSYGIDFSYFSQSSGYKLAKLLGREMQNVRMCRRKIPILMASFGREPYEIRLPENLSCFGKVLGLNTSQAKVAVSSAIKEILERKRKRRTGKLIRPGVELIE